MNKSAMRHRDRSRDAGRLGREDVSRETPDGVYPIGSSMKCRERRRENGTLSRAAFLLLGTLLLVSGCVGLREPGKPLRTAISQLLLSQALERTLDGISLPVPGGAAVLVEAVGITRDYTPDQEYARKVVALHLARQGFRLAQNEAEATYRITIVLQTFGTEQGVSFLGIPPLQSIFLPFPIPEMALYKSVNEKGFARMSVNVIESATGTLISSGPWYGAATYYNQYTVLFAIMFHLTDLELAE